MPRDARRQALALLRARPLPLPSSACSCLLAFLPAAMPFAPGLLASSLVSLLEWRRSRLTVACRRTARRVLRRRGCAHAAARRVHRARARRAAWAPGRATRYTPRDGGAAHNAAQSRLGPDFPRAAELSAPAGAARRQAAHHRAHTGAHRMLGAAPLLASRRLSSLLFRHSVLFVVWTPPWLRDAAGLHSMACSEASAWLRRTSVCGAASSLLGRACMRRVPSSIPAWTLQELEAAEQQDPALWRELCSAALILDDYLAHRR